jgi:hypothetical protein
MTETCPKCLRNGSCPDHPGDKGLYVNGRLNLKYGPPQGKILIHADMSGISMAMEDGSNEIEHFHYLDVETGEVLFFTEEELEEIESDDPEGDESPQGGQDDITALAREVLADADRFIPIPRMDSSEAFRHMEDFLDTVGEPRVTRDLGRALSGSKPFRRFKDALEGHPPYLERWYAFKDGKMTEAVKEFLSGIERDR